MSNPTDFLDSLNTENVQDAPEVEAPAKTEVPVEKEFDAEHEADDEDEQEDEGDEPEAPAKVEEKAAPTAASEPEKAAGFKAGMLAERKKRQELEAKLRAIETAQKQPEPVRKPVVFRDEPERFVLDAVAGVEARHMNALEDDMREQHEDFDDMAALVVAAAELDPALRQKVFSAGNPARAMYKLGKQLQESEKLRDPEAYKASIRDDVVAEVTAKLRKELGLTDEGKPAKAALPRDLSNGRSGTNTVATTQPVDPRRGEFGNLFDPRSPPS